MKDLKLRMLTGFPVAAVAFIVIVCLPSWVFPFFIVPIFIVLAWEWLQMIGFRVTSQAISLSLVLLIMGSYSYFFNSGVPEAIETKLMVMSMLAICIWLVFLLLSIYQKMDYLINHKWLSILMGVIAAYLLIVAYCVMFTIAVNNYFVDIFQPSVFGQIADSLFWTTDFYNKSVLFIIMFQIGMSDIGAYFAGNLFGTNKLSQAVSPGKTWEGLFGAVVFCLTLSLGFTWLLEPINVWQFIFFMGILFPAISVIGDLVESGFKRGSKVKDSSGLLPGHGGFLDRADSHLFIFPCFFLYLQLAH